MSIDLLKKLVSIPSISGNEDKIATFVFEYLHDKGLSPKRKGDNVWVEVGSGKGPRLLLNSHLDTVPVTAGWTKKPFEPHEENGKLYGLGANDAKASVAAMMTATIENMEFMKKINGTLVLAIVCNEETGRMGIETIIDDLQPLQGAIVGEPNGMNICIAQKGALVLNLTWTGKSAHAAHGTSDHAVKKAVQDLSILSKMNWPKIDPFLGETRLELTQVHAGDRVNVVPDRATATVDIRYAPVYHSEEILGAVRLAIQAEVGIYSDRRKATKTDPSSAIVQAALKSQPGAQLVGSKTSSDWVFLGETPAIKMGPGNTEKSHTADEYVELSQIPRGVEIYSKTIRNFFDQIL